MSLSRPVHLANVSLGARTMSVLAVGIPEADAGAGRALLYDVTDASRPAVLCELLPPLGVVQFGTAFSSRGGGECG